MEGDDRINGTEYIKRLRRQHERLHPTPDWAKEARLKAYGRSKRRRSSVSSVSSGTHAVADLSPEEDNPAAISTQPLAELLRSTGSFARSDSLSVNPHNKRKLRLGVIDIGRTKDVTGQGPSAIDSLQFHPHYPLLLSSGPGSTIYLHHISPHPPNPNPLLTSLHIKGTPLRTAAFCPYPIPQHGDPDYRTIDSTRIFFSSRRRYFHTWSLGTGVISKISRPLYGLSARSTQRTLESFKLSPCGRYMGLIGSGRKGGGSINVISTTTMQWLCSCRIDSRGGVADFAWWGDGSGFAVVGKNGGVSEFEIAGARVIGQWVDDGAFGSTVIALGGKNARPSKGSGYSGDSYVAIGSSSGIVNVYERRDWNLDVSATTTTDEGLASIPRNPKPVRSLSQLTTPISHLLFSTDGQMLVMASRWKKDALRLVHLPSCTVYRNWPTDQTPLGRISSVALGPGGGLLAVGNERGKIRLWEIRAE